MCCSVLLVSFIIIQRNIDDYFISALWIDGEEMEGSDKILMFIQHMNNETAFL